LEGELNVEESGKRLNGDTVLGVIQEVSLTALIPRVPFKDIEIRILRALGSL